MGAGLLPAGTALLAGTRTAATEHAYSTHTVRRDRRARTTRCRAFPHGEAQFCRNTRGPTAVGMSNRKPLPFPPPTTKPADRLRGFHSPARVVPPLQPTPPTSHFILERGPAGCIQEAGSRGGDCERGGLKEGVVRFVGLPSRLRIGQRQSVGAGVVSRLEPSKTGIPHTHTTPTPTPNL
jgi:hypothetical protein